MSWINTTEYQWTNYRHMPNFDWTCSGCFASYALKYFERFNFYNNYWLTSSRQYFYHIDDVGWAVCRLYWWRQVDHISAILTTLDRQYYVFILQWQHLPTNTACPIFFFLYWSVINRTYTCKLRPHRDTSGDIVFKYIYHRPVNVYLRFKIAG